MRTLKDALTDHSLIMIPCSPPADLRGIFPENAAIHKRDYTAAHFTVYFGPNKTLECVTAQEIIDHLAQLEQALGRELGFIPVPDAQAKTI